MTLIVEDGTGLTNANGYVSVAETDEYFTLIGNSSWTGSNEAKETAIINGTIYIDIRWGALLLYCKLTEDQSLEFPRDRISGIPVNLKRACMEYAVRSLSAPLMPDPEQNDANRVIKSQSEGLGRSALVESVTYADNAIKNFRVYPLPDSMMRNYIRYNRRLVR